MNLSRVSLLIALFLAGNAHALEGVGYASDPDEARRRAAADLAAAIQVRIHSVVESCTQVTMKQPEDCGSRVMNRSATELPLLGLRYQEIPGGNEAAGAKALLEAESSGPLYRAKLTELGKEFAAGAQALAASKDRRQMHDLLTRQIAALRALADHRLVAVALGLQAEALPASETALAAERAALEETVDSIPFAARVLLKGVQGRIQDAEPLTAAGSREATPLGSALADALRAEPPARQGPRLKSAGEYRILANGDVDVVVEIRNEATRELAAVRTARLAKAGYAGYRAEPLAPDFEKLLREGVAVSGELRAELVTAAGVRQLKFKAGENVRLAARLNRPGYFYLVGHVVQPEGQFSYLMPLQAGAANDASEARFIRYVPPEQVNHYLVLGEFSVEPPYGAEHLQIIASTQRPKDVLPAARYDSASGYFVLQGSRGQVQEGLMKTRGLIQKTEKSMVAEGVLTFTTSPR
ncbi:MAG: DUF4384 domain-containing protein [Betaproteobacteria bacterium]|nr:DUF4384 domain-containing protein [Betaproteobacteria bacterium]